MSEVSVDTLRDYLSYNEETDQVVWKKKASRGTVVGKPAGCLRYDGYSIIRLFGKNLYLHRIVWALKTGNWPDRQVDHINKNRQDNSFKNLRLATRQENQRNKRSAKNTSSKYLGVCYHVRNKRWQAQAIGEKSKNVYLGTFDTEEEAALAYNDYAKEFYGEFASLNDVQVAV
jgi:citrate synthase